MFRQPFLQSAAFTLRGRKCFHEGKKERTEQCECWVTSNGVDTQRNTWWTVTGNGLRDWLGVVLSWWRGCRAVGKHFISLRSFPVCWKCFPAASPPPSLSRQCIGAKPTHASVLLSSPTQSNGSALYLTRLVWCFFDMPSLCHHYAQS